MVEQGPLEAQRWISRIRQVLAISEDCRSSRSDQNRPREDFLWKNEHYGQTRGGPLEIPSGGRDTLGWVDPRVRVLEHTTERGVSIAILVFSRDTDARENTFPMRAAHQARIGGSDPTSQLSSREKHRQSCVKRRDASWPSERERERERRAACFRLEEACFDSNDDRFR